MYITPQDNMLYLITKNEDGTENVTSVYVLDETITKINEKGDRLLSYAADCLEHDLEPDNIETWL